MPSLKMESYGISAVATSALLLRELLQQARIIKPVPAIEPALEKSDFPELLNRLSEIFPSLQSEDGVDQSDKKKPKQYAILETAARDLFSNFIATTSIDSPEFVNVWNLLDLLSILSDNEQCDPALLFWLIEELLDSQTISGCRKIYDFLESRRERITAKQFKQKSLVILRTSNELLRRLSRAEDTAFCGRVFIFMFQSFPLGDRSSVNLRGEYHVENVTIFDEVPDRNDGAEEKMDVDTPEAGDTESSQPKSTKTVSFDGKKLPQTDDLPLDPDALYPVFWSLQASFSQPKKLFDATHFANFKAGLETTMAAFRKVHKDQEQNRPSTQLEDSKRNIKRKREEDGDEFVNAFNPKYLTSRDLFELELRDLSFRRHVLLQAIIIMEFLLSLSAKAKEKLASIKSQNKSVVYADQLLSEDDAKWASEMKRAIADYLKQGLEGPYFYRVVETILSRDKNWARWKVENCPPFQLPVVSPGDFLAAQQAAQKNTTNKRLRPSPMGSLPLSFLQDGDSEAAMEKFMSRDRYELPELGSFKRRIADNDFEIEMPTNSQTKAAAVESKASNSWRALRIASKTRLAVFDKIDDQEKIDIVFEDRATTDSQQDDGQEASEATGTFPSDLSPIILVGPEGAGKASLSGLLLERSPGVFQKIVPHTTRKPAEGEVKGIDYHFVDSKTFDMMRDGDQLVEFTTVDGHDYGTSRRLADGIAEKGQVPLMLMQHSNVEAAKEMGYSARVIGIKPLSLDVLEARLKESGISDDKLAGALKAAEAEMEHIQEGDLYDVVIENDDLETAYKSLQSFIYGQDELTNGETGTGTGTGTGNRGADVKMDDVNGEATVATARGGAA